MALDKYLSLAHALLYTPTVLHQFTRPLSFVLYLCQVICALHHLLWKDILKPTKTKMWLFPTHFTSTETIDI